MKRLLILVLSLIFMHTAHAGDFAKLRMKISGPIKDNRYFLCVSNAGCVSILIGNKGKLFPLNEGDVDRIFLTNVSNMKMSMQKLPQSCHVSVNSNQTLTVRGTIVERNGGAQLANLNCSVN